MVADAAGAGVAAGDSAVGTDGADACCALQAVSATDNMAMAIGFGFMAVAPGQVPRSVPHPESTNGD